MGALRFACPDTGRTIDPGIGTDHQTFGRVREVSIRLRCPHCHGKHSFHVGEGYLAKAA